MIEHTPTPGTLDLWAAEHAVEARGEVSRRHFLTSSTAG